MASGSFNISTSNGYIKGKVSWSSTENVAENYSTVSVEMRLWRTNTGYTTWGTGTFNVVVNGSTISSGSKDFTLTYNSNTLMVSGSRQVTHNSDGKKSITISWSGSSNVFNVTSGSGTATLDTIPRASTMTSNANWIAGVNKAIGISRASSSFHHTIIMYVNGVEVKRAENVGTSVTMDWNTAENTKVFQQLAGKAEEDTQIRLYTYDSDGTYIGSYTYKTGVVTAPAASVLTSGTDRDVYIDQTISVGITRSNSEFTHTLVFQAGNGAFSKTVTGVTTSKDVVFTQAEQEILWGVMKYAKEVDANVEVHTYYNGVKVRTHTDNDMDFWIRNANPTFTAGFTYKDTNTSVTAATGNNQVIVQGKSTVLVEIPTAVRAIGEKGAVVEKYEATLAGTTKAAGWSSINTVVFDFGALTDAETDQVLTIKAIDSRGNSTEVTKTVTVAAYKAPSVSADINRLNDFETDTTLKVSGGISPVMVGTTQKNSVTSGSVEYRTKKKNTTTWGSWVDLAYTVSGYTFDATAKTLQLDNTSAWDVEVRASDRFQTATVSLEVGAGQPLFHMDELLSSVGVNKFPTRSKTFEVLGDTYLDGGLTVENGFIRGKFGSERIPAGANLDDYKDIGFYYCPMNADATNIANTATNQAFSLFVETHAGVRQTFSTYHLTNVLTYVRNYYGGSWGPWCYVANVLEQGENSNGRYIRHADGTQFCYKLWNPISAAINNSYKNGTSGLELWQATFRWTFPVSFTEIPTVNCSKWQWSTAASWGTVAATSETYADLRGMDIVSRATGNAVVQAFAIGRWK